MKKLRLPLLLLIFCCMMFVRLTYVSFEKIDQMVSALAGEYMPTIVLDAGHGGEDGGAVSKNGIIEKDVNLAIAMNLKPMLEMSGFHVVMIREADVSVGDSSLDTIKARKTSDIHNRLKAIEENGDCVFLSIHQNHFDNSKYSGAQIFYGTKNSNSQILADQTQQSICKLLQPENKRATKPTTDSIYLLRNATVPAVIVECGFLSNSSEAKKLNQPEYQRQMAFAIYQGFLGYWNSVSQTQS